MWPIGSRAFYTLGGVSWSRGNKGGEGWGGDELWSPKRGKAPANMQRAKLLAARALAAYPGYASTRKVQTPEKTKNMLLVVRKWE